MGSHRGLDESHYFAARFQHPVASGSPECWRDRAQSFCEPACLGLSPSPDALEHACPCPISSLLSFRLEDVRRHGGGREKAESKN